MAGVAAHDSSANGAGRSPQQHPPRGSERPDSPATRATPGSPAVATPAHTARRYGGGRRGLRAGLADENVATTTRGRQVGSTNRRDLAAAIPPHPNIGAPDRDDRADTIGASRVEVLVSLAENHAPPVSYHLYLQRTEFERQATIVQSIARTQGTCPSQGRGVHVPPFSPGSQMVKSSNKGARLSHGCVRSKTGQRHSIISIRGPRTTRSDPASLPGDVGRSFTTCPVSA